jgi:hypothetical protein
LTLRDPEGDYQHFRGMYISIFGVALKMEMIYSFEKLVTYKTTCVTTQTIAINNKDRAPITDRLLKFWCVMLISNVGGNYVVTIYQGT